MTLLGLVADCMKEWMGLKSSQKWEGERMTIEKSKNCRKVKIGQFEMALDTVVGVVVVAGRIEGSYSRKQDCLSYYSHYC